MLPTDNPSSRVSRLTPAKRRAVRGEDDLMSQGDGKAAIATAQSNSPARFIFVKIPHAIAGTLLLAAIAINIANVVGRYVFSAPVFWAEESLIDILVWGVFIAAGSISYAGNHLSMDFFTAKARAPYRAFLGGLIVVLTVTCAAFVVTQSLQIVSLYYRSGEVSMGAHIPLVLTHSAVLVGFTLMGLAAIIRVRAYVTNNFN
jgi:TRAP-type C4-dicarboxylate transport system permease small subunit